MSKPTFTQMRRIREIESRTGIPFYGETKEDAKLYIQANKSKNKFDNNDPYKKYNWRV